jgi:MFS family permease
MIPALVEVTLDQLLILRIVLGVFEAAVMTSSTTLIGDYFVGKDRQKWLILQTGFVSFAGIVFIGLGGFLGEIAWNAPFYAYGLFLIGVPFAVILLHEPEKHAEEPAAGKFPWRDVIGLYGFAFAVAILFLIVPVQLPFLLTERGITSPQTIGITVMMNSVAILVGSLCFRLRADAGFKSNLIGGYCVIAIGVALLVGNGTYQVTVAGAILAGLGAGFLLPCIVTQIMSFLPFELRGRGTGRFNAAYFMGNFLSPLIVLFVSATLNGLSMALIAVACFAALCALLGFTLKGGKHV